MSSRYSELFVVSYGSSALNTTTRDSKFLHENSEGGLVCLWSILLPEVICFGEHVLFAYIYIYILFS